MLKHKVEISRDKRHIVWTFSSFIILHLKKNSNYDPLICHKNTLHFKKSKKIVLFSKSFILDVWLGCQYASEKSSKLSYRFWTTWQTGFRFVRNSKQILVKTPLKDIREQHSVQSITFFVLVHFLAIKYWLLFHLYTSVRNDFRKYKQFSSFPFLSFLMQF